MKKGILYIFVGLLGMFSFSCNQDIEEFDNSVNYVCFDIPYKLDSYGRETTELVDSLTYSFAMDDESVTSYTFQIPVNMVGLRASEDRPYKVAVDEEQTTAAKADWESATLESAIIEAQALRDTLEVVVNRTEILKNEWRSITLCLQPNLEFQVGATELSRIKIAFTDILQPPVWWTDWEAYFGEFVKEKYIKWQEIYYLGADPTVEQFGPDTGKQLYWDQMPYYVMSSWYPTTFMFIKKLKQYFIDNEVYPDGDTSKPRITLP